MTFDDSKEEEDLIQISTLTLLDILVPHVFPSKTEVRKLLKQGAIKVNGDKEFSDRPLNPQRDLLHGKYIIIQWGKWRVKVIRFDDELTIMDEGWDKLQ